VSDEGARVELIDGLQEAKLIGEFDLDVYEKVCAELAPLFEATGDVTLDLSGVGFLDSSAIRLFVQLQQSRGGQGSLVLRAPAASRRPGADGRRNRGARDPGGDRQ
jgi:anti-anti-sigma factor